jgi:hypothetical protein
MKNAWAFLAWAFLAHAPLGAQDWEISRVDTARGDTACFLPALYFLEDQPLLLPQYREELIILANALNRFPDLRVSLTPDLQPRRFEGGRRRLNKSRVEMVAQELEFVYQIAPHRILRYGYQPWHYRRRRDPLPQPLSENRVSCACVWESRGKRQTDDSSEMPAYPELSQLPVEQP